MTEKKRKSLYWTFKVFSILVACGLPMWSIAEKFPMWTETHGAGTSIGVGFILALIVLLIVFRKTVFEFIKDHINLKHAPSITVWIALLIVAYVMVFIGDFFRDMTTVLWMGLIGSAIGNVSTYIAESRFGKKEKANE